MGLMKWFKSIFKPYSKEEVLGDGTHVNEIDDEDAEDVSDHYRSEVARRAWETGNMVTGEVDDEGKLTIKEYPMEKEK